MTSAVERSTPAHLRAPRAGHAAGSMRHGTAAHFAHTGVQVVWCRLQIAGCRLQVAGCGLHVSGAGCRVAGCRLQARHVSASEKKERSASSNLPPCRCSVHSGCSRTYACTHTSIVHVHASIRMCMLVGTCTFVCVLQMCMRRASVHVCACACACDVHAHVHVVGAPGSRRRRQGPSSACRT